MKKAIWKGNKKTLIILIVLLTVVGALAISGVTYAVWTVVSKDNQALPIPVDDYNPSEKYIVFRALDDAGNLLDGDLNAEDITAYAVVGYSGLVAEVVIPETHNGKAVVKICTSNLGPDTNPDFQYRFNGNAIITSLQIPATVTEISASACAEMSQLTKVEILGSDPITIGDYAFANCPNLTDFTCSRETNGDEALYLLGSKNP